MPINKKPTPAKMLALSIVKAIELVLYGISATLLVWLFMRIGWIMMQEPYGIKALIGFTREATGFEPVTIKKVFFIIFVLSPMVCLIPAILGIVIHAARICIGKPRNHTTN